MAEARARDQWLHTSTVLSMLGNCHRDPKRRPKPFTPTDFNPYEQKARAAAKTEVPFVALKWLIFPGAE